MNRPPSVIPPAAFYAIADRALRGHPSRVYMYLLTRLTLQEWRRVKFREVMHGCQISDRSARESLRILTQTGYIKREREPATIGGAYTYLLVEFPPPRVTPTAASQAA